MRIVFDIHPGEDASIFQDLTEVLQYLGDVRAYIKERREAKSQVKINDRTEQEQEELDRLNVLDYNCVDSMFILLRRLEFEVLGKNININVDDQH